MARGIEKRNIFLNAREREGLVLRLSDVLTKSGTACLAGLRRPDTSKSEEV
jgi:hypothetical protein